VVVAPVDEAMVEVAAEKVVVDKARVEVSTAGVVVDRAMVKVSTTDTLVVEAEVDEEAAVVVIKVDLSFSACDEVLIVALTASTLGALEVILTIRFGTSAA